MSPENRTHFSASRLQPAARNEIHATGFTLLFSCMALPQNRCTVLCDMHETLWSERPLTSRLLDRGPIFRTFNERSLPGGADSLRQGSGGSVSKARGRTAGC